ncbi:hypothetical protein QMZ30_14670 [Pantoea sp. EA-12]|uniref:hypothetical protein n=1 Tax=Pantoea sp. EA-12 TaxID=3043303 RepID=UPI0024B60702|nr:hypothetical protein [Pantoea sp. EA-12]MDI9222146.1 hypothetical protein [Pantoea sp. EA-12]
MKELEGFLGAALQFSALEVALHKRLADGLEEVAACIEQTARDEIGFYQPAVGPFQDWASLAESTEADKARKGFPLEAPLLRTGEFRDTWEHEVSGFEAVVGSKDNRAPWFEFGTVNMPPRPVLGPAVIHNEHTIRRILGRAAVTGMTEGTAIHKALGYDRRI